jgi:hypothetical protein
MTHGQKETRTNFFILLCPCSFPSVSRTLSPPGTAGLVFNAGIAGGGRKGGLFRDSQAWYIAYNQGSPGATGGIPGPGERFSA